MNGAEPCQAIKTNCMNSTSGNIGSKTKLAHARGQCARRDTRTCAHILDTLTFLGTCAQIACVQQIAADHCKICKDEQFTC